MAKVFTIEPNPRWVIIDNFSKLPNGGAIYTFDNKNHQVSKPAFADAAGTLPYGTYVPGFGNGTFPPIYWQFDDADPTEGYYIQVWDKPQIPGNDAVMLWDFNNLFGGSSGGGGGGTVTTNIDIENLVVNGEFYHRIGDDNVANNVSGSMLTTLAPSNHNGVGGYANNVNDGPPSPDIIFAKSNVSATDAITFTPVSLGTSNLIGQPTPEIFVNFKCTGVGTSETYKYFQFPLVKGVQNTSAQNMSINIFARITSGTNQVQLKFRQFFGNGGTPSADVLTPIGAPLALTSSWNKFQLQLAVPSVTTKNIGTCNNDCLYLQIAIPSNAAIDFDFILPSVYFGTNASSLDFHTVDQVDAIVNTPRTGDIRMSLNNFDRGWVVMNDGTIGNVGSGAGYPRGDCFQLFDLIWTTFQANQTLAPMVPPGYGASSYADFNAGKQLTLTAQAGRVIAGISGSHAIGTSGGADTHLLTQSELPASMPNNVNIGGGSAQTGTGVGIDTLGPPTTSGGHAVSTNFPNGLGNGNAIDIRQPTVYQRIFIKL